MDHRPIISIITVCYNAASTIGATMRSVAAQSGLDECEHIIVDGASADATKEIVARESTPVTRWCSEPDHGIYDAMNKGMRLSRGQYLIFLNAGDRFHAPDTLSQIIDAIHDNGFPGVVYGQTQLVDIAGNRIADRHLSAPLHLTARSFAQGMLVCHQAFVARADLCEPYNLSYRFSSDYDWCVRVLKVSERNVMVPGILIDYLSEGITTANRRASLKERFDIMCRHYGTIPTVLRHIKFIPRYVIAKLTHRQ